MGDAPSALLPNESGHSGSSTSSRSFPLTNAVGRPGLVRDELALTKMRIIPKHFEDHGGNRKIGT